MSIVKTNKFQTLDGMTYNIPIQVVTSSLGAADLGTTVSSTSDQTNPTASFVVASTTTTWTDMPSNQLQLTITPKFSNSIIKLNLSIYLYSGGSGNAAGIRVRRGTKIVFRPSINAVGPYGTGYLGSSDGHFQQFFEFYDSPGTVAPVTYNLQYRTYISATTCRWFGWEAANNFSPANYFTATEIAQ